MKAWLVTAFNRTMQAVPDGGSFSAMKTKKGQYYIGKESDSGEPVLLKASSLTTHGVIFGMTGSGKTGLGVNVLEEALLDKTPTLILDPKGDMGNIMLNFPESSPEDLEPWIDAAKAKRKGKTVAELAEKESAERREELAADGITPERIAQLRDTTDFRIYTPGSSIGIGMNVLGSLEAPKLDWDLHAETIRDEIEGLVSSILVLAGVKSDPVSGPEHILLSMIIETWWRQGKNLDLATLVGANSQAPVPQTRGVRPRNVLSRKGPHEAGPAAQHAVGLPLDGILAGRRAN